MTGFTPPFSGSMPRGQRCLTLGNSSMPYFEASRLFFLMPPEWAISIEIMRRLMPTMA